MKEVKEEKFNSRNSILKPIFTKNNIDFISNIWIVTCRYSINKNKNSRYLVIIEGEYNEKYKSILEYLNPNITVINVNFNEIEKVVSVYNIKTKKSGLLTFSKFKDRIIELTQCGFIESYALGSNQSSPLSRYFRENMGKGFALTDIDFYLTKTKIFIEEKTFVLKDQGFMGVGQCISFKEFITDIFPNVQILIICSNDLDFYIGNLKNIDCNCVENISGWGNMVPFKLEKISQKELINLFE